METTEPSTELPDSKAVVPRVAGEFDLVPEPSKILLVAGRLIGRMVRAESDRKRLEQFVKFAFAVCEGIETDANFVEQRQV